MRASRIIVVIWLCLLFVVSTNRCVIAAAFPAEIEECCPSEQKGNSEGSSPCSGSDCAPCATLGVNLAALAPPAVPPPVWTEEREFAEMMRRLAEAILAEVAAAPPDPVSIPAPLWLDVMKKALPVRGPSLVA
jgi:hypothetical protein